MYKSESPIYRLLHVCKKSTNKSEKLIRPGKIVRGLIKKPNNARKATIKIKGN